MLALGVGEKLAEFQALGFAAGEGVEGLAEAEVAEAGLDERTKGVLCFGDVELLLGGRELRGCRGNRGFGSGERENLSDGAAVQCDVLERPW